MITIKNLSVAYPQKTIFTDISLDLPTGQIIGVIGPNGGGKSTLIKSIARLIPAKYQAIIFNGQNINTMAHKLAYVEQRSNIDLTFPITVGKVVELGIYPKLKFYERPSDSDKEQIISALKQVKLDDYINQPISSLSGGQLQRIFIARALVQDADLILLDEPFVGIDVRSEEIIIQLLKKLCQEGKTIIMIHHDLTKVNDYFNYLLMINHGIIASGNPHDIFIADNIEKTFGGILPIVKLDNKEAKNNVQ